MFIQTKIRIKRIELKTKETARKLHVKAQKIALAVVIAQFLLAIGYYGLVKYDILPLKREVITVERVIKEAKASENETITPQETTEIDEKIPNIDEKITKIVDYIYLLESSNGKNDDKCERIGKHNGYGYRQGINKNYCLESDEEMREIVKQDIFKKLEKNQNASISEILCLYNSGELTNKCDYVKNLNLN